MNVRELSAADAERLAELELLLFAEDGPWPAHAFVSEISQPHTFYAGAEIDGTLVGYAGIAKLGPSDSPEFEVHTIGVDPTYQRRGIAQELMRHITHAADLYSGPMFLEVRTDNEPAIGLYEKFGFSKVGTRRRYYQPSGADAYTMVRPATDRPAERKD